MAGYKGLADGICPQLVVAIPAMNEAECIAACLAAFNEQLHAPPFSIVLLANNCTDATAAIAQSVPLQSHIALEVIERQFCGLQASAGYARHVAMREAAQRAENGILLTTDADSQVAPNWLAANLQAIAEGADAVAGRAVIDPDDAMRLPAVLHEDNARECAYDRLLDQIAALLDPDPSDPWPRHTEHSGASIAVTAAAFHAVGGMPSCPTGEDRAFFKALRLVDTRVRHAPEVEVVVSGRIVGRASGGMADTIRRRLERPDDTLDDRLEGIVAAVKRAKLRAQARKIWASPLGAAMALLGSRLPRQLDMAIDLLADILSNRWFGAAWSKIEALSPRLERQVVLVSNLRRETARAKTILRHLQIVALVEAAPKGGRSKESSIQFTHSDD